MISSLNTNRNSAKSKTARMIGIANIILQPIYSFATLSQISLWFLSLGSISGTVSLSAYAKKKPETMKKLISPSCIVLYLLTAISLMNTGTVTVTIPLTTPLRIRPVHMAARCCIIIINDDMMTIILAIMSIFLRPYFKK